MKKILFLTILLLSALFVNQVNAMIHSPVNGSGDNLTTANIEYNAVNYANSSGGSGSPWTTSEYLRQSKMPDSGTISNLYFKVTVAPGSGKSHVVTVRKNSVDTSLTCTIADAETECSDASNSFTYAQGDLISIKIGPVNSPALADASTWSVDIEDDTAKSSSYGGCVSSNFATEGDRVYLHPNGDDGPNAAILTTQMVVPLEGTIDNFTVDMTPGDSTFNFSIYKNGVEESSSVLSLSSTSTSAVVEGLGIDVTAGDLISISAQEIITGTGDYSGTHYGFNIIADTDGESILSGTSSNNAFGDEYNFLTSIEGTWQTETPMIQGGGLTTFTMKDLIVDSHDGSVSTLLTYNYTIRKNGASTDLTCFLGGAGGLIQCQDTTNEVSFDNGDETTIFFERKVSSGSGERVRWAVIQYIAPATGEADPTGNISIKDGELYIKSNELHIK
jgi:hypothetical protein